MKNYLILFIAIFGVPAMGISGCASTRLDLTENEAIKVERVPAKGYYISRAFVYRDGDEIIIGGWIKRRNTSSSSKGHVDMAIFGPEGELIQQISTNYMPRIIPRKGRRASVFEVHLSGIPDRSTVRIAYHRSMTSRSHSIFDCGANKARI